MRSKSPQRVLITGASGMLGFKLAQTLSDADHSVVASYKSQPQHVRNLKNIERIKIDITKPISKKIVKKLNNLDFIIHCAAFTDVNKCESQKQLCTAINVDGTRNIVDLARYFKAKLIYISTPLVFGSGNAKEIDTPKPKNHYGKTKLLGEKETLRYDQGLVVRVNPIGIRPSGNFPSFIQWFVNTAKHNKSFNLFSDIEINPVSVDFLSQLIRKLIIDFRTGILHVGSRDTVNKADIWSLVVSNFPKFSGVVTRVEVNKTSIGKQASRPPQMLLGIDKIQKLGYKMPSWRNEVNLILKQLL